MSSGSLIEHVMGDPGKYVERAAQLTVSRSPLFTALDFIGNADGSAGAEVKARLWFQDDPKFPDTWMFQWADREGYTRRQRCPRDADGIRKWLNGFFTEMRARQTVQKPAATGPSEIPIEPPPSRPRKSSAAQLSLF